MIHNLLFIFLNLKALEYIDPTGLVQRFDNLNDYQKLEKIGEGADGVVYKPLVRSTSKLVVFKVINNFQTLSITSH